MRAIAMLCHHAGEIWQVPVSAFKGDQKQAAVSHPRQAVMYVAVKELGISTGVVGRHLGNRDHTTILHGCRAVLARIDRDLTFRAHVKLLVAASQKIPESAYISDAPAVRDVRRALRNAACDAADQLLDLAQADPDAFRALLTDVMRGNLQRTVERALALSK